jgi:selenide, water dikinase
LCGLAFPTDENVLIGLDRADDAGVYRISDDLALIQTVDFFTPIVDDPYWFGQIAAANALSDVYAMGGVPKTAMNLVAFPVQDMDLSVLRQIIQGGIDKLNEAGVVLLGGHSVEDKELKYGLSVTGLIHPARVLAKKDLRAGDRLVLTKPLGTGIVNTAVKAAMASSDLAERATRLMAALNRDAARVMADFDVSACTDVTGFGLLGHLAEMVSGSGTGARVDSGRVPVIPEALKFASMGMIPAGAYNNREFRESMIHFAPTVDRTIQDVLVDPQTSGGLLISVKEDQAAGLVAALHGAGIDDAAQIGEVIGGGEEKIWVV